MEGTEELVAAEDVVLTDVVVVPVVVPFVVLVVDAVLLCEEAVEVSALLSTELSVPETADTVLFSMLDSADVSSEDFAAEVAKQMGQ